MADEPKFKLEDFRPIAPPDSSGETAGNDMQEAVRKNSPKNPDGSYRTNQGTVYLMSPADRRRAHLMATVKPARDRYGGRIDFETARVARVMMKDPELDIDWGRYAELGPEQPPEPSPKPISEVISEPIAAGETMVNYYGRCRGGPYNTRNMNHGAPTMIVATDIFTGRVAPGVQLGQLTEETYKFGTYRWNETAREWQWDEPAETAKAVNN